MTERQSPDGSGGGVRSIVHALLGVALGGAYVLVSGILGIQAEAARGGFSVTLGNRITEITEPGTPVPQFAAAAILGAGVWFLVTVGRRRAAQVATVLGFVLASLALIAWALMIQESRTLGELPWASGVLGWVQVGGQFGGVHLLVALTLASLWLPRRAAVRAESAEAGAQIDSQSNRTSQAPSSS